MSPMIWYLLMTATQVVLGTEKLFKPKCGGFDGCMKGVWHPDEYVQQWGATSHGSQACFIYTGSERGYVIKCLGRKDYRSLLNDLVCWRGDVDPNLSYDVRVLDDRGQAVYCGPIGYLASLPVFPGFQKNRCEWLMSRESKATFSSFCTWCNLCGGDGQLSCEDRSQEGFDWAEAHKDKCPQYLLKDGYKQKDTT